MGTLAAWLLPALQGALKILQEAHQKKLDLLAEMTKELQAQPSNKLHRSVFADMPHGVSNDFKVMPYHIYRRWLPGHCL